jgi:2-haloacid dehalogenase/putative hydrolase of the HAD superfamily
MADRHFDAVFMDFYGTVCAGDRAAVAEACQGVIDAFRLPLPAEELAVRWGERFFAVLDRSNHDAFQTLYECECLSLLETLQPWVPAFDPDPFVLPLENYWRNAPMHDDAKAVLAQMPVPVCCVSNADSDPLSTAIRRHGLTFTAVLSSEAARCYKPDPMIFAQAARRIGVDPARVLHVGDSLHSDVSGAAKLGIATVWLCRDERIHDIGTSQADHTIHSLHDLLNLV